MATAGPATNVPDLVNNSIQACRAKLLDLTLANRLLNFKHSEKSRSHVRVIDEIPEILFEKLGAGKTLLFADLGDPEAQPQDEKSPAFERALRSARESDSKYAEAKGRTGGRASRTEVAKLDRDIRDKLRVEFGLPLRQSVRTPADRAQQMNLNPAYDLPVLNGGPAHTDNRIQTLLYRETMEAKLAAILDADRTLNQESGVNALYCAFGFVEWYESATSDTALYAPLLFYPIEMERSLLQGQYAFKIKQRDDEIECNVAFAEKLKRDFGLELPPWSDDLNLIQYFSKVEQVLSIQPRWNIKRWITVGLFTFSKLVMYKDLDESSWQAASGLAQHRIINDVFAGVERTADAAAPAIYDIDALEKRGKAPLLVTDCDSSQHSAIVDVLSGRDCVIQGPPGTGKSQTITNIIGAALHAGKTVLFVAEKMAALTVVKDRLDHYGLGQFCLELHSNRTRKTAVRDSLASRLSQEIPRTNSTEVEVARRHLELAREDLLRYVQAIQEPFGTTGLNVCQVLRGSAIRSAIDGDELAAEIAGATIQNVEGLSRQDRERWTETARSIEHLSMQLGGPWGGMKKHPWRGFCNTAPESRKREQVTAALEQWGNTLQQLSLSISSTAESQTRWRIPQTVKDAEVFTKTVSALPCIPENLLAEVLPKLLAARSRSAAGDAIALLEDLKESNAQLQSLTSEPVHVLGLGSIALVNLARKLAELELNLAEEPVIADLVHVRQSKAADCERSTDTADKLQALLSFPGSIHDFKPAQHSCELLNSIKTEDLGFRCSETINSKNIPVFQRAIVSLEEIRARQARLDTIFDFSQIQDRSKLKQAGRELSTANLFQRLFGKECGEARALFRKLAHPLYFKEKIIKAGNHMLELAAHFEQYSAFDTDPALITAAGPFFEERNTPWDALLRVSKWCDTVRQELSVVQGNTDIWQAFLLQADANSLVTLRRLSGTPDFKTFLAVVEECRQTDLSFSEHCRRMRTLADESTAAFNELAPLRFNPKDNHASLLQSADQVKTIESLLRLLKAPDICELCPGGTDTDIDGMKATVALAHELMKQNIPGEILADLFSPDLELRMEALRSCAAEVRTAAIAAKAAQEIAIATCNLDSRLWLDSADWEIDIDSLLKRTKYALGNLQHLEPYLEFANVEGRGLDSPLKPVMGAYRAQNIEYTRLSAAFERCFYQSAAALIFKANPELSKHSGLEHEQLRKRFQKLDREMIELHRRVVANACRMRPVDPGNNRGRVSEKTGLALIQHQIGSQTRHTPLRSLFRRAGSAVQALKPCFMMSPMSVAQFLEPGAVKFDLVVMDEASQIRPEDALGAIARGKQLVVVGDPMQLPPTSFFDRIAADAVADDEEQEDILQNTAQESVLDLASSAYTPMRRLLWHYRSQHESLIAFSNSEFYDNELIVFPSPKGSSAEYGVKLVPVAGKYLARTNREEAEAIVAAAQKLMNDFPKRSLGIVAINQPQRDLILGMMDEVFATDPVAEAYRFRWAQEIEQFFIKNLENVQGDERDVIFISTVYAPDDAGVLHQRFGPINSRQGHRRLNVLFTRAKQQIQLFTSMTADQINIAEGTTRGVKALKNYLQYAREGTLNFSRETGRDYDSEFERWVSERLGENDYEVVPQLGVAGYFLDLAVRNPDNPGAYLAGIECDGASYHSAKSARDRDRLRQLVLENLGWKIYRIWSTDWFRNPAGETRKVLQFLEELKEKSNL